jgi:hypothetical protein
MIDGTSYQQAYQGESKRKGHEKAKVKRKEKKRTREEECQQGAKRKRADYLVLAQRGRLRRGPRLRAGRR